MSLAGSVLVALAAAAARATRARRGWQWAPSAGRTHLGPLAYRTVGEGPPTVVLLHGLAGSGRYWGAAFDELAGTGQVVVPDLLGFGRSPRPDGPYGVPEHVDAVVACLDELDVRRPVLLATHSFGGIVALAVAAERPELVGRIVAFGPPWYPDPGQASSRLALMGPMARLFALDTPWGRRVCDIVCAHRDLAARLSVIARPDLPPAVAADGVQHNWSSYQGSLGVIRAAPAPHLLASSRVPIRVVIGDRDRIPDLVYLTALADAGRLEGLDVWPGGHDLPLTAPGRAVAHIRRAYADTDPA